MCCAMMATANLHPGRMPDVTPAGRHTSPRDNRTPRRLSRKSSDGRQDVIMTPRNPPRVLEKRHAKADGAKRVISNMKPAIISRRTSDSALPPIRGPVQRHLSETSPRHHAPHDASSPTSISLSSPLVVGTGSSGSIVFPAVTPQAPDREEAGGGRDNSCLSIGSSGVVGDTFPQSPALHTPDVTTTRHYRHERRVLKPVSESPQPTGNGKEKKDIAAGTGSGGGGVDRHPHKPADGHKCRRIGRCGSLHSLPKLLPGDEPFSIRRKIEQFRKWHEEQYHDKMKKLRADGDKEKGDDGGADTPPTLLVKQHLSSSMEIDFAKILEDNIRKSHAAAGKSAKATKSVHKNDELADPAADSSRKTRAARCKSGATWRTWRDVNDSYAYNDVSKYIEENELLPPDRVTWINSWLGDVEKALEHSDPGDQGNGQVRVSANGAGSERQENGSRDDALRIYSVLP